MQLNILNALWSIFVRDYNRVVNSLYAKTRGANSELVTVELRKSYCMLFILYATEALPLSNRIISMLDSCVSTATANIFLLLMEITLCLSDS